MKKILLINACARKASRTYRLAKALEDRLSTGNHVEEVKLYETELPTLDENRIAMRDRALMEGDFTDSYFDAAKTFREADEIIVAAPYWDLSFPSVLKQYLELVSINGITFRYTPQGIPEGLCKAETLYYVTTAGGEIGELNLGYDYVKALSVMLFGIGRTYCIRAVGLDMEGVDSEAVLENAIENLGIVAKG